MELLIETAIGAALTAAVLAAILWVGALLRRPAATDVRRVTVLFASGEAQGLEQAVRETVGSLYIADGGMSVDARRRAEILAARYGATILAAGRLSALRDGGGSGDT